VYIPGDRDGRVITTPIEFYDPPNAVLAIEFSKNEKGEKAQRYILTWYTAEELAEGKKRADRALRMLVEMSLAKIAQDEADNLGK
jgi:hypothetical protein